MQLAIIRPVYEISFSTKGDKKTKLKVGELPKSE
jgi:hypothetical protein